VLKASERNTTRNQTMSDLSLYVSNPQVRRVFVEALNDEQNTVAMLTAVRELVPYANETEVRDAYLRLLESGKTDAARMTAAAAVARRWADDKSVRDRLLRVLSTEKKDAIRSTIIGALSKHVDDAAVLRAMIDALRTDEKEIVRARAARALAAKVENAEVYDLLLNAARSDQKRVVRAIALDALTSRIRERTELRELFVGYLDDESQSMQYHALKGLVELNDAALKPRLVEKAREIILTDYRRGWNTNTILSALVLLRKLDPQEADRMLEQLGSERVRSF
jgi:HEAT repeat protein